MTSPHDGANPFAAPEAPAVDGGAGAEAFGYEAPRTAVIGGLYACAVANLVSLVPILLLGEGIEDPAALLGGDALTMGYLAVAVLSGLVFYVTAFLWGRWVLRAARNLRAFSPDGYFSFTPASHIWWFIVPVLSLWKPLEGMREIETVSIMSADADDVPHSSPLGLWWGLWLAQMLMGLIVSWSSQWWMTVVSALVAASSAIVAARTVKYINALQESRARR